MVSIVVGFKGYVMVTRGKTSFSKLCPFFFLLQSSPDPVKEQILSMIQTWSTAFRKEPKYKVVQDTFNLMRMEGEVPCGIHSIFSNLP